MTDNEGTCPPLLSLLGEIIYITDTWVEFWQVAFQLMSSTSPQSTFPPKLSAGLPKRHHVILYIHCKLRVTTASAQALLKPDHREVGAYAWFNRSVVSQIVSASEETAPASDTVIEGSLRSVLWWWVEWHQGALCCWTQFILL